MAPPPPPPPAADFCSAPTTHTNRHHHPVNAKTCPDPVIPLTNRLHVHCLESSIVRHRRLSSCPTHHQTCLCLSAPAAALPPLSGDLPPHPQSIHRPPHPSNDAHHCTRRVRKPTVLTPAIAFAIAIDLSQTSGPAGRHEQAAEGFSYSVCARARKKRIALPASPLHTTSYTRIC